VIIIEFFIKNTARNVPKSAAAAKYPKDKKRSPFAAANGQNNHHGK